MEANNTEGADISVPSKIIEAYLKDIDVTEFGKTLRMGSARDSRNVRF